VLSVVDLPRTAQVRLALVDMRHSSYERDRGRSRHQTVHTRQEWSRSRACHARARAPLVRARLWELAEDPWARPGQAGQAGRALQAHLWLICAPRRPRAAKRRCDDVVEVTVNACVQASNRGEVTQTKHMDGVCSEHADLCSQAVTQEQEAERTTRRAPERLPPTR
jgi:hypothetical protein